MPRDVIVVGAGGGGAVVAKELAERGLDVLLLEAGPHADPEREWTHLENDATNPIDGFLRFGPPDRARPSWFRETSQNSLLLQVGGVGGTTQHYFANSPRAMPGAFVGYDGPDKTAYDTEHAIPFPYAELVPYYEWVEHTLPVQTAPMGTKEELFFRGAAAIGLPLQTGRDITRASFRPQENAILQPGGNAGLASDAAKLRHPDASGCTFCGSCFQGCLEPRLAPRNLKAKRSTDNSYAPMALTVGVWKKGGKSVTLVTDAFVTRISTATEAGALVAKGVQWRVSATGERHAEDARVVVLAAGSVEDPRLWFNSDLPNPNDWIGRGLTDHFLELVTGVFPTYTGSSKGPASAARTDFPGAGALIQVGLPPAVQAVALTMSDHGVQGAYTNGLNATGAWDGRAGRLLGPALREVVENVDHLVNILILTDDDVEADNRIQLSALMPADEHGPVAKVTVRQRNRSARTLRNREFLANQAARIIRGAGADKVFRIGWPPVVLHIHSTMRMGHRESDSVLTGDAETRAVKRLFVADNSALPNALGGPNPTLTTQAIATRTAEKIFGRYFGGDPWVGHESPVSSIDDAVTSAVLGRPYGSRLKPDRVLAVTGESSARTTAAAAAAAAAVAAAAARRAVRE